MTLIINVGRVSHCSLSPHLQNLRLQQDCNDNCQSSEQSCTCVQKILKMLGHTYGVLSTTMEMAVRFEITITWTAKPLVHHVYSNELCPGKESNMADDWPILQCVLVSESKQMSGRRTEYCPAYQEKLFPAQFTTLKPLPSDLQCNKPMSHSQNNLSCWKWPISNDQWKDQSKDTELPLLCC